MNKKDSVRETLYTPLGLNYLHVDIIPAHQNQQIVRIATSIQRYTLFHTLTITLTVHYIIHVLMTSKSERCSVPIADPIVDF